MQIAVVQSVFPQEPLANRALSLLEKQSSVVAELGLRALKARGAQAVMEAAVEAVASVLDNEMCKVLELLPDRQALLLRAGVGWQPGLVGHGTVSAGLESQAGFTLMQGGPVVVTDLRNETRFSGPPLLHNHGVVSGLSTPIYTSHGPWGVIGTHSKRPGDYSRHDQDFLVAVANVLGAAIERERYEQELDAARQRMHNWDQMRARFLHNVAHELRTPLTPLMMHLQALDRLRASMEPHVATGVQVARRSAQRLQDMVNDFVELTKMQAQVVPFDRERVDLARVAQEVVAANEHHARGQDVSLTSGPSEEVWVEGDTATLARAVTVLVENGLKFTPEGGAVNVKVVREGDFGTISVQDTGVGLEPQQVKLLFQPFTQATLFESSAGGLGVGLAIAKEIVDLHGGHIGVESPGPGQGARFWFMIRLAKGERLTEQIGRGNP